MTLILNGTDNSATTPAVTGTDTDTGVYYPAANQVALATNGTLALFVDANQNVGVGTTSPDIFANSFERNLGVFTSGGGTTTSINVSGGAASRIQFGVGTTRYGIIYQDNTNFMQIATTTALPISFLTNSVERIRIPSNASGITFPATQVASADANTLDDYEEGTWTPSVGGTATYTGRYGRYVKVGKMVTVQFLIAINTIGTGATTQLQGLPFTSESIGNVQTGAISYFASLAVSRTWVGIYVENGNTTCQFVSTSTATTAVDNGTGVFGSGTNLYGSITYMT